MTGSEYLIHELARITGVSVRTIRFYIDEGVLPESQSGRGKYKTYSEEYVDRLNLIGCLKRMHLPLAEIVSRVAPLTRQQVLQELKDIPEQFREDSTRDSRQDTLPGFEDKDRTRVFQEYFHKKHPGQFEDAPHSLMDGEVWERVALATGIELWVKRPPDPGILRKINQVIAYARRILKD